MRRAFTALAFFAALSVLAQPVCAVQEIHLAAPHGLLVASAHVVSQDSHDRDACCPAIEADMQITASPPVVFAMGSGALAAPCAFAQLIGRSARARPVFSAAAPPSLTYHARSARILR